MSDSIGEVITTTRIFCFASGQLLTLNEDQIDKIPYLAAIVSSGDSLESARNEHGHYILDPHIEFKYFAYVLELLSFHSVRQIFTHLPKQNDIIPIIALFDFLCIGPTPDPNLNEVDSIFFSNLVYSPMLKNYLQIVRPSVIQDMAVRFAIAMVKEEYDFTNRKVIDQIYWFVMFILSAHELFGTRLRHHVYKIAEHCFSLFEPSLLKPLKKLIRRTEKDTRKILTISNDDASPDEENERTLEQILNVRYSHYLFDWFPLRRSSSLQRRQKLLFDRTYSDLDSDLDSIYFWGQSQSAPSEVKLLEPIHKCVLEIMYERLQSTICQRALAKTRKYSNSFIRKMSVEQILHDIFECEFTQEIRECILEEIPESIPKLEKRHEELVQEIRHYNHNWEIPGSSLDILRFYLYGPRNFEYIQEEALSHELLLKKLYQRSTIVEQIHRHVVEELYTVAREQITDWANTARSISLLRLSLSSCRELEEPSYRATKTACQSYRLPANKPLPKLQFKHSMR